MTSPNGAKAGRPKRDDDSVDLSLGIGVRRSLPRAQVEARVRAEMIRALFRQSPAQIVGNYVVVMLVLFLLWRSVPQPVLLTWALAIITINAIRLAVSLYFDRVQASDAQCVRRSRVFTALTFLSGLTWGSAGIAFLVPEDLVTLTVLTMVLPSIAGGAIAGLAMVPVTYFALALPTVTPFIVFCFYQGRPLDVGMGMFVFLLSVTGVLHFRGVNRNAYDSEWLRFENAALIDQLQIEKDRAQAADRAKSKFLAAASHDLRQPAHALSLFAASLRALAQRADFSRADVEHIAQRLHTALQSMGRLLNSLLDVTRLDAGVVEVNKQPVCLQAVLDEVAEEFREPACSAGIALKVLPTSLWVYTDRVLLMRILSNLTSNAVRYTERGRVLIGCRRRGGDVVLRVHDTGIGIAEDQLSSVFKEFYQVRGLGRNREQGLGLGLSIVRRSADLLVARIEVHSTPGRGSTFGIVLPKATPIAEAIEPAQPNVKPGLTILALDDNPQVLSAMGQLLTSWGHRVLLCSDTEQALASAAQTPTIDFILADYHLGGGQTGAAALDSIQSRLPRRVPAVVVTGDTSPERLQEASRAGIRVLHKPVDERELMAALRPDSQNR